MKPSYRVRTGEKISGILCYSDNTKHINPEPIPLKIVYEDRDIVVINKEAGVVVHPSPGHYSGTLVNGILYQWEYLRNIFGDNRPGIIHRLDKGTSGLIIVAKNMKSLIDISHQFKQRTVKKQYLAIVYGVPQKKIGTIDLPIGRHRINRKKMSTFSLKTRSAKTHWKLIDSYSKLSSLVTFSIETGRTHQIRVHCKAINIPILGDPLYNSKGLKKELLKHRQDMVQLINSIKYQMLHSHKLKIKHPISKKQLKFKAKLPSNMITIIKNLKKVTSVK